MSAAVIRLRQMAVVAADRDRVVGDLRAVFGLEVGHEDPAMSSLGLHNAILPVGDQFVEVVAEVRPGTTQGRFLQRRGGDSGYMLIFQTDDHARHRAVVEELGVRVVARFDAHGFTNMQLHPADTGGTFFEIDQQDGADKWEPAGREWPAAVRTDLVTSMVSAEVACARPYDVAQRWARLLALEPPEDVAPGETVSLALADAELRFVDAGTGPEGIVAIGLEARDVDEVLRRATAHGLTVSDDGAVRIAGVAFRLVPEANDS